MNLKSIFLTAAVLVSFQLCADINIIPKPNKIEVSENKAAFELNKSTVIVHDSSLIKEAQLFQSLVKKNHGITLKLVPEAEAKAHDSIILFDITEGNEKESYQLEVAEKKISVLANHGAGIQHGGQSLLQLIPLEGKTVLPACKIIDAPRFSWRGAHLDVGRHFFTVDEVKTYIDYMVQHKLNTFHWHLTEDQGWRIQIKKYPRLTSFGGFRDSTPEYNNKADNQRYGGFYTQEDIKEVVRYAMDRHITVLPEIDMPGHMSAAIAAYPHLGNDDIPNYNPTVKTTWGIHGYILSPKESTFEFVENVLEELCQLFPSRYIHIGGDEAAKGQWRQSKFAQSVIKREGLHDEHDLQSYFIKRVEKILEKRGRKLIGWDEIREGGLSPNATMMQWRGQGNAVASAKEGHDVVVNQNVFTYLNCYQEHPAIALQKSITNKAQGRYVPLSQVYNNNPVPEEIRGTEYEKHIIGYQLALWSEYLKDWKKLQYQAFPRFSAVAEVAWTKNENKDYEDYLKRLPSLLKRYKKDGINYFNPFAENKLKTTKNAVVKTDIKFHDYNFAELALDGTTEYFAETQRDLKAGQFYTVELKEASTSDISLQTGRYNRRSKKMDRIIENAVLETSMDGKIFTEVATLKDGKAVAKNLNEYKFIRIRLTKDQSMFAFIVELNF